MTNSIFTNPCLPIDVYKIIRGLKTHIVLVTMKYQPRLLNMQVTLFVEKKICTRCPHILTYGNIL